MKPCVIVYPVEGQEINTDLAILSKEYGGRWRGARYSTLLLIVERPPVRDINDPWYHIDLTEMPIENLQVIFDSPNKPPHTIYVTVEQAEAIHAANRIETPEE